MPYSAGKKKNHAHKAGFRFKSNGAAIGRKREALHDAVHSRGLGFVRGLANHHQFRIFIFNHTATTEIYTLSLHDALPISEMAYAYSLRLTDPTREPIPTPAGIGSRDRKSTRLNSSHITISYAVFCLK